ncbi:hypothetical protein ACEPAI_9777 [Sanghuangporus weigelae]
MFKLTTTLVLAVACTSQVIAHGALPSGVAMLQCHRKVERMRKRAYNDLSQFKHNANDSLCILTPGVTQGPYQILGELVRQNITQEGVPMELDVDFINVDICDSGNKAASASADSGGTGAGVAPPSVSGFPSGTAGGQISTTSGTYAGEDNLDSFILIDAPGDNNSFLRGVWQADESGHLMIYSIVPGWYSGCSTHFHIKVYTEGNGSIVDNGTFNAGSAVHTGQIFFADSFMAQVGNLMPYNTNTIERLTNDDDMWSCMKMVRVTLHRWFYHCRFEPDLLKR